MLRSDFLVLNEVRRELARTQANLERIQFGVTRGVIFLGGEFWIRIGVKRLDGEKYFDALVSTLIGLEKRLRRIPGVKDIFFRFSNIERQGGFWHRANSVRKQSTGIRLPTRGVETPDKDEPTEGRDEESVALS
jgi:hypothetical protein